MPWCSFCGVKKTLASVAVSAAALSAGAGVASASVNVADVEQMISAQLGAEAGSPPDSVDCPGDLASDVGASVTCAVTRGDETRGVTATVASVNDGQVQISLQLARQ